MTAKPQSKSEAEDRRAAALRENLRKRREQSRLREARSSRDEQVQAQQREVQNSRDQNIDKKED